MTEINKKILECIGNQMSIQEISNSLNLSIKQVYNRILSLQNQGFLFKKVINNSGDLFFLQASNRVAHEHIKVCIDDSFNFKAVLISDIHIGNMEQNFDYLNRVYEYCDLNDIHTIINTGDLVDGIYDKAIPLIDDPYKQIETLVKKHPYSSDILNIICLGDHDDRMNQFGIDTKKAIECARYDLIPLNYNRAIINIGNEAIGLKHYSPTTDYDDFEKMKLVISGHHHKNAFFYNGNQIQLDLSSLSDLQFKKDNPGFVDMDLQLKKGLIHHIDFKFFDIDDNTIDKTEGHFIKFKI